MPSDPEKTGDGQQKNVERLFLGLPEDARLPQVVGAHQQWATTMTEKVRRKAGDETIGVAIARIGLPKLAMPQDVIQHGDTRWDPVGGGDGGSGGGQASTSVPQAEVNYTDTEPVVVVTLDTSKLNGLPAWTADINARVVNRPGAQVIPSSYGLTDVAPDEPEFQNGGNGGGGSVFEASLGSATTFALIAGGFGAAYYWFGTDG